MPHFTDTSQNGSQGPRSVDPDVLDASEGSKVLRVAGAARPILVTADGEAAPPLIRKNGKIDKRSLQQRAASDVNEVVRECQDRLAAARTGPGDARIAPEGEEAVLEAISRGEIKGSRLPRPLKAEHDRKGVARCLLDEAIAELRIHHRMSIPEIAEDLGFSYRHIYERWRCIVKRSTESDLILSESDKHSMRDLIFGHLEDVVATAMARVGEHASYGMVVVNALSKMADLGALDVEKSGSGLDLTALAEKARNLSPMLAERLRGLENEPTMTGGAKLAKAMDKEMGRGT